MKENFLCSVIIPVYNAEKYIEDTINSVLLQTYSNIEIIIINDCSKDNTLLILEALRVKDKRIIIETLKENSGVSVARNRGIEISKGKYITFLDADDLWKNEKLEKQVNAIIESNYPALCCTGCDFVNEAGVLLTSEHIVPYEINIKILLKKNYIICSSVMVSKSAIEDINMEGENIHEDYLAWLRIIKKYGTAIGINENLTTYRVMSNSRSSNKLKGIFKTYRVYRMYGLNMFSALYYSCWYIINGLRKYSKIKAIK